MLLEYGADAPGVHRYMESTTVATGMEREKN